MWQKINYLLLEATKNTFISKAKSGGEYKNKSKGKNRFERQRYSTIPNASKQFNQIDMNKFFKDDELLVKIPVIGETDNYTVSLKLFGVVAEIQKNIKNNKNKLEFRTILQSITKVYNTTDIYIKCTCLDENTKIKLLDGTAPTIKEMYSRFNNGEKLWVYSVDKNGDFKPGEVEKVFISGTAKEMIKITLDNEKELITTPDHLFMLRNGEYLAAENLKVGQSLMPLYFNTTKNGYETIKYNSTGKYHSTYKVVGEYYFSNKIKEKELQAKKEQLEGKDLMRYLVAIHHKDFNKNNNNPDNLQIMTGYEHWLYHANTINRLWENEDFRKKNSERSSEWMTYLNNHPTEALLKARIENFKAFIAHNYDPIWLAKQSKLMSAVISDYWHNLSDEERTIRSKKSSENFKKSWAEGKVNTEKFRQATIKNGKFLHTPEIEELAAIGRQKYLDSLTKEEKIAKSAHAREIWLTNSTHDERSQLIKNWYISLCKKVFIFLIENKLDLTAENYEKYRLQVHKKSPKLKTLFSSVEEAVSYFKLNHKVIKIEKIKYESKQNVYDIKVKNYHNFYTDAGVILHNCPDYTYTWKHELIVNNMSVDDTASDNGPGKGIRNPKHLPGLCKHSIKVLMDSDWIMKIASVIWNYIKYAEKNLQKPFLNIIFPKLYGIKAEDMITADLIDDEKYIKNPTGLIDAINKFDKNKAKNDKKEEEK